MQVLLTNDDGIDAPGIRALEAALGEDMEPLIVAPDRGYSGCSHQVTSHGRIDVAQLGPRRFKVFGSPADCVRLGVTVIAPDVEWVLSGINAGANLGVDLLMSGTVAAVREATWLGKRGIAISQFVRSEADRDWERSRRLAERTLQSLWPRPLAAQHFWNVNLPDQDDLDAQLVDTFPEPRHLDVTYREHEGGYTFQGNYRERPRTAGSDVDVCFGGSISLSCVSALS